MLPNAYHTIVNPSEPIFVEAPLPLNYELRNEWLANSCTAELRANLSKEANKLEDLAETLACSYHQTNNHLNIVQLLIRAAEIRKIINAHLK